jgi:hypothetical protein
MQDQGECEACVGFAVTAAAEAAVNVHLGQSWNRLNLSEQDLSFCRWVGDCWMINIVRGLCDCCCSAWAPPILAQSDDHDDGRM